ANSAGSNGTRSSGASPMPISLTGMPRSTSIARTTPPFAVPSSLVSTTPVTPTASVNWRACARPFCPVVASITRRTSCGAPGVRLAAYHVGPDPLGPVRQLIGGGGPKRVGRSHQRDVSVVDLALGELGDRRGLARPVDADEQPYGRPVRRVAQRPVDAREVVDDLLAQERDELLGVVNARRHRPRPELVEQAGRRRHAD